MTTLLAPDMLKDLEQLHLSKSQLQEVQALLAQPGADPTAIIESMGERGWLTSYQVNELVKGRGKELRIGPYVIVAFVGEGGMGVVFKAVQPALGRVVALKIVKSERLSNPRAVRRFQREVKATAQLNHPNIVSAYHADQADNKFYLVMEFVYGNSLAQRVLRKGPLRLSRACDYIRQTALGMQHAHERGMIHRDIKPQNLMLTSDKTTVKILDLGLARMVGENAAALYGSTQLTQAGAIIGSLDFMAPEQAVDPRQVDARADLYSIGCTFYYLLTGRVPFPLGSPAEKIARHKNETPRSVEELRPEVPACIGDIVRKLMAKYRRDRYQDCGELIDALDAILGPRSNPSPHGSATPKSARKSSSLKVGINDAEGRGTDVVLMDDSSKPRREIEPILNLPAREPESGPGIPVWPSAPELQPRQPRESKLAKRSWPMVLGVAGVILGWLYLWQFSEAKKRDGGPPEENPYIGNSSGSGTAQSKHALKLDGKTGHVFVPLWRYEGTHPISVELWATPQSAAKSQVVFGDMESAGMCLRIDAGAASGPRWEFAIGDALKPDQCVSRDLVQWGKRTHLAVTFDGHKGRLFVDGRFQSEFDHKKLYRASAQSFLFGARRRPKGAGPEYDVDQCFAGIIDEIQISKAVRYSTEFTPPERNAPDPDTVLLYHLDEGKGDIAVDSSGKQYHGIVKSGATWTAQVD
jgi:serine/threonine-protein kinase